MKAIGIVMTMLLISSIFAASALAFPWNSIKVFADSEESDASAEIAVDAGISDVDVADADSELEIEVERKFRGESVREVGFPVLFKGQGWVVAGDSRAAFANVVLLEKKVATSNGNVFSSAHGRLKFGEIKLKMESTESTDDRKVFALSGGNNVAGTLKLERSEKYDGLSIWKGEIVLEEAGDSDDRISGTIVLAMHESRVKPQIVTEVREKVGFSYQAKFNLDQLGFKAIAKEVSNEGRIDFYVYGQNNVEGKLRLNLVEKTDSTRKYSGELRLEEAGDSDDRIEGSVRVSLQKSEDNVWKGTIYLETGNGDVSDGEFYLYEERIVRKVSVESSSETKVEFGDDSSRRSGKSKSADFESSNSGSGSVNSGKNGDSGFWRKVIRFFSGSN